MPYIKSLSLAASVDDPVSTVIRYYKQTRDRLNELDFKPKISVIVPVYKVPHQFFRECLQSVAFQIYENWEICIVDDASGDPGIESIVKEFQSIYPGKIHFKVAAENGHISKTSNECLKLASGDYIALLDHDDRLLPNALAEMVRHIYSNDFPEVLYSDERVIDGNGKGKPDAFFKPKWSKYLHMSVNYTTHLSVYKKSLIDKIGGFRIGTEGAQDHDLMMRATEATTKPVVHVPFVLYQWRAHAGSTAEDINSKGYAAVNGEKCVTEALQRRGLGGEAVFERETVHYRVKYKLPEHNPLVSIIIPNRNSHHFIEACVRSIIDKSSYKNFEIVVSDNGSDQQECLDFYKKMADELGAKWKLVMEKSPFNFGRQVNKGVTESTGEYVILLNNDTEVISEDWIEELLRHANLPDAGAVGCKLLYKDHNVQHAGIVCTGTDIATGITGYKDGDAIYINMMQTTHEVTAVTAACMMIKKSLYEEVGMFNDFDVANGYGDVDFCLKLVKKGYLNLYTPYARLYHVESPSRGVSFETYERFYMRQKWGGELINDPYLNPNFLLNNGYQVAVNSTYQDIDAKLMKIFLNEPFEEWAKYCAS